MITVLRWIETPACRRRVEIDVHDFLMAERDLASKYGVPWHPPVVNVLTVLAAAVIGLYLGFTVSRTV
jgi:hypothetical protein